ncbi:MAG: hypothetical protein ACI4J1_05770 [Ruminiclostridium sp.]
MVNIICTIAILGIAIVIAVILALQGKNKGMWYGVRILGFTALSAVISVFLSPVVAAELSQFDFANKMIVSVIDMAEEYNANSALLMKILTDSVNGLLEIPSAIFVFLLAFISFNLIFIAVMAIIKPKKCEVKGISRVLGSVLAAVTPILLAAYIIFVPEIKLLDETKNADRILEISNKGMSLSALTEDDISFICDFYFSTTLLDASEDERIELINTTIDSVTSKSGMSSLKQLSEECVYLSADEVKKDAATVFSLIKRIDISKDASEIIDEIAASPDINEIADSIYSLKFGEPLVRMLISEAVRSFCIDSDFSYPADKDIEGTQSSFAELIQLAARVKQNPENLINEMPEIRNNSLISSEMLSELSKALMR